MTRTEIISPYPRPELADANLNIKCEHVRLRPFEADDAPRIYWILNRWDMARTLARIPYPFPKSLAVTWLCGHAEGRQSGSAFQFAVVAEKSLVGCVSIEDIADGAGELGYWMAQSHWGRGLTTEAAIGALRFGFSFLFLEKVTSGYFVDNAASGGVQDKLGFIRTGTEDRWCMARDQNVECITTEISRQQFEARHGL
jgi:8-oxo-dGTP diphosphatase